MLRFLAAVAALVLVALLAACHDEIPVEPDNVVSATAQESDSDSAWPWSPGNQQPKEALNWGVTEQDPDSRYLHISYRVNTAGGLAWDGVDLTLSCFDGTDRTLSLSSLPWIGQNRTTLLIALDDQPPLTEDVYLRPYKRYGPNGLEGEQASAQLDDSRWYELLRSRDTLTIVLAASDMNPVVFDLTRLFGTPLQDELDECTQPTVQRRSR